MNARTAKPQPLSNIITLPRPPSRPLEISGSLPLCPCCAAPAFEGEWRGAFDLHHACDCILERAVGYERGVQQLWEQRQRERRYLETLPTRYRAYTFGSFERTDGNTTALEVATQLEPGRTLFLWGNPGNGKTHLACAIGFRAL